MADQQPLPFGEAEGTYAERKAMLGSAIIAANCDLHVATLLFVVFQETHGGRGEVEFRHDELKRRPDRLCCEVSTVRAAIARAKSSGLLSVRPTVTRDGFRGPNAYAIGWIAVSQWNARPLPASFQQTPVANQRTYVANQQTSVDSLLRRKEEGEFSCLDNSNQEIIPPPPPPPNAPAAKQQAIVSRQAQEWSECEERLRSAGMKATSACLAAAKRAGMFPDDLTALIDFWQSRPAQWGPGAIFHAVREWRHGMAADCDYLWPTPVEVGKWSV